MSYFENKTVVVPFDFSDTSKAALGTTLELVEPSTQLHVLHVVEPTPVMATLDPSMVTTPFSDDDRLKSSRESLESYCAENGFERFQVHCLIGDPGNTIVDFANQMQANMIVIPSHGRTGLTRLLLGSVAERVLRLAHCPVLVLREPA